MGFVQVENVSIKSFAGPYQAFSVSFLKSKLNIYIAAKLTICSCYLWCWKCKGRK